MGAEADRIRAEYARRAAEVPAGRYAATEPANLLARQAIERGAVAALRRAGMLPLAGRRALDVGCGHGQWLADLRTWGAAGEDLAGIDLVPDRVEAARRRLPEADVREGDAATLPWDDGSFDVVVQSMMFSSILDPAMRRRAAAEMARVLGAGGAILWYDFFVSHPRNPHVRGMRRREIAELFPGFVADLRRVTLAPPVARRIAGRAWPLAVALGATHALDTHYIGTLRRR